MTLLDALAPLARASGPLRRRLPSSLRSLRSLRSSVQATPAPRPPGAGRLVTFGTADGFAAPDPGTLTRRGIRLIEPLKAGPPPNAVVRELLADALERAADGRLRPVIGATRPLDDAAGAHRALADRSVAGKSLLIPR